MHGQAAYMAEATTPWDKLARYWEAENAHWQKHPEARPVDPGPARWRQLWAAWEKA
jgi:hypothetical protein